MIDLEQRRNGLGGSDIAKILGVSKFATALEVWAEKTGSVSPKQDTAAMQGGHALEIAILWGYREIEKPSYYGGSSTQRDLVDPFLFANPDNECSNEYGDRWLVDAKNVIWSAAEEWGDPESIDAIPLPADYYWQGLHYCHVCRVQRCDFAVLIAGTWPPRIYRVVANPERYAEALPTLRAFWKCVETRTAPPPDFMHPTTIDLLRRMYPRVNRRRIIELTPQQGVLIDALAAVGEAKKKVESVERQIKGRLLAIAEDAYMIIDRSTGVRARRREVKGGFVNYERRPYAKLIPTIPDRHELRVSADDVAEVLQ